MKSEESIGPAEKACLEFEARANSCERLHKLGRRRWNLEERIEYIRLHLNELNEKAELWGDSLPKDGMMTIRYFLFAYFDRPVDEWDEIDAERAREDNDESF